MFHITIAVQEFYPHLKKAYSVCHPTQLSQLSEYLRISLVTDQSVRTLSITGCDGTHTLVTSLVYQGSEPDCAIVVPGKKFVELLEPYMNKNVTVTLKEESTGQLTIHHKRSKHVLPVLQKDQYFTVDQQLTTIAQLTQWVTLPISMFKDMLRHVQHTFADSTRFVLSGPYITIHDTAITCTGTNGQKLVHTVGTLSESYPSYTAIIDATTVTLLQKELLTDISGTIQVAFPGNSIVVKCDTIIFFAQCIQETYPDIQSFLTKQLSIHCIIPRDELITALKSCIILSPDHPSVRIAGDLSTLTTIISLLNATDSSMDIHIPVVLEKSFEFAVNAQVFLSNLQFIQDDSLTIEYENIYSPIRIKYTYNTLL